MCPIWYTCGVRERTVILEQDVHHLALLQDLDGVRARALEFFELA